MRMLYKIDNLLKIFILWFLYRDLDLVFIICTTFSRGPCNKTVYISVT